MTARRTDRVTDWQTDRRANNGALRFRWQDQNVETNASVLGERWAAPLRAIGSRSENRTVVANREMRWSSGGPAERCKTCNREDVLGRWRGSPVKVRQRMTVPGGFHAGASRKSANIATGKAAVGGVLNVEAARGEERERLEKGPKHR
jgi:hypothetical protein